MGESWLPLVICKVHQWLGIKLRDIILLIEFKFIWPILPCHILQLSTFVIIKEELPDILLEEKGRRLNWNHHKYIIYQ